MTKRRPIADSSYVIDGVARDFTPAQLLDAVSEFPRGCTPADPSAAIVDESLDPQVSLIAPDPRNTDAYLACVMNAGGDIPLSAAAACTRVKLAAALIEALWKKGDFRLEDLSVKASWSWNCDRIGSGAAFYESVLNASEYIDDLGLKFSSWTCRRSTSASSVSFRPVLASQSNICAASLFFDSGTQRARMSSSRTCPASFVADERSWVVYIPFDTSEYRLGGSLLAQAIPTIAGASPEISDADYFIDCYEVVRELSQDGILLSAATVSEGGLLKTVSQMCPEGTGMEMDISDIMASAQEKNPVRVLFSEVPGAVIQIRDSDFDYLDAELLLQDVAFYPLGHPVAGGSGVRVKASAKTGIQRILESLMQNAEGED